MRAELDKKKDVLASMESELAKASHWNGQVVVPFHRCDMMLSKYTEQVSHLGDRWRRINGQIDTRHVVSRSECGKRASLWARSHWLASPRHGTVCGRVHCAP